VSALLSPPAPLGSARGDGGDGSTRAARGVLAGCSVGVLGGLIGLGGAEFRLPLLIGAFGFVAVGAVIMNKAMSLVVVLTALPARLVQVS
jgi:hypothetical protein